MNMIMEIIVALASILLILVGINAIFKKMNGLINIWLTYSFKTLDWWKKIKYTIGAGYITGGLAVILGLLILEEPASVVYAVVVIVFVVVAEHAYRRSIGYMELIPRVK